jgi:enterobacterial common antigen flippase
MAMSGQVLDGAADVAVPQQGSASLVAAGPVEAGEGDVESRHDPAGSGPQTYREPAGSNVRVRQDTVTSANAELATEVGPSTTGAATRAARLARRVRRTVLRPTIQLTAANVGAQALSMLSGLLVARQLGTVGRGQVSLVQVYDEASTNASSLGAPTATGYFAKERPSSEAKILGAALTISAVSLPITALVGWLVATFIFADAPLGIQLIVWAAVGLSPLANSYPMACRMVLVARGQTSSLVPLQIAQMALRVGAMLALISADAFTATSAAVAVVTTGWLASLIALRMVNVRPVRGGPVREVLAFGLKTVPASLASMANTRLDQMLVAPLISASALGVYSVAVGATILPLSVGVAIALAGFHTVKATAGFDGAAALLRKACVVIPVCAAVNALGIILFLEPIYGHQFSGSVVPALILIPGATATALFMVVAPVGHAIGAPSLASWSQGVGLAVTIVGLPVMLPILGINGAALVSSVAYSVRLAVGVWLLHRRGVSFGRPRGTRHRPS